MLKIFTIKGSDWFLDGGGRARRFRISGILILSYITRGLRWFLSIVDNLTTFLEC